jgi:hypothetical protein
MATTKISNSGLAGIKYQNISADNNYMETIASTLLATTATGVTFSNIPQGYKHLQVRILARDNRAVTLDNLIIQANGDTGSNYSDHFTPGGGSFVQYSRFSLYGIKG